MNKIKLNKGGVLPFTLLIGLCGVSFVLGFYGWAMNINYHYNRNIAKIKAFYNAETGMARKGYEYLWKTDFVEGYEGIEGEKIDDNMGSYLKPKFEFDENGNRIASVYGIHEVRTNSGAMYPCSALVSLPARPQTLGIYMYLTESEEAGGAPFVFDAPNDRREVNFSTADILEGVVQTNGQIVVSDYGCPDFGDAEVYLTNSTPIDLGGCSSYQDLFNVGWGADIDTMSKPPVKLPPTGYNTLKNVATHIIEANSKINPSSLKDTLIMTDIEFKDNGEYRVKQWWYLMPPHLIPNLSSNEIANPQSTDLDLNNFGQLIGHSHIAADGSSDCPDDDINNDIRSCPAYNDFLQSYHAKYVGGLGGLSDQFLNSTISGPAGFHHFDIDQPSSFGSTPNLILDQSFPGTDNTVIYVKDGPVRVHGKYKGRYTVVTDEYTTYRRHAWPEPSSPIDTIWNNIWITKDLINVDAIGFSSGYPVYSEDGNLEEFQPGSGCEGGSENIMGLVSGANIYISNTRENGAVDQQFGSHIVINAGLIALNESFVVQYWQNSTNSVVYDPILGSQITQEPPWGDARGDEVGTITSSGANDLRGYVYLWGGVVQKHRGYMKRNPTSPYGNASIGMDKSYHYDANLDCNPPPFYPAIEFDDGSGEIDIKLIGYNSNY